MKKSIALILSIISILLIIPSCGDKTKTSKNTKESSKNINKEKFDDFDNEKLLKAKIGEIITFGTYEQDGDKSNGKEDIEWIVLDKDGDKALLISKYVLDSKTYNEEWLEVTWESCTLRKWLNKDFFDDAFNEKEKSKIQTTNVSADGNLGNDTEDKIFLLSKEEAKKYFSDKSERECQATNYAIDNHVYITVGATGNETCWWWLRSPADQGDAVLVVDDGDVGYCGTDVYGDYYGVRPAMWVEIK